MSNKFLHAFICISHLTYIRHNNALLHSIYTLHFTKLLEFRIIKSFITQLKRFIVMPLLFKYLRLFWSTSSLPPTSRPHSISPFFLWCFILIFCVIFVYYYLVLVYNVILIALELIYLSTHGVYIHMVYMTY